MERVSTWKENAPVGLKGEICEILIGFNSNKTDHSRDFRCTSVQALRKSLIFLSSLQAHLERTSITTMCSAMS